MRAMELQGLNSAIKRSFASWADESQKYTGMWQRISADTRAIAFDAIDEMNVHKPGFFEVWWATNHNRYIRRPKVTQKESQLLFEIFYAYLSAFSRGELLAAEEAAAEAAQEDEDEEPQREVIAPSRTKTRGRR